MRTVVAVVLFAVFALVAVGNAVGVVATMRRKASDATAGGFSVVPVLGGVAGALACVMAPSGDLVPWSWLPLVLDVGSAPTLALAVIHRVRGK